MKTITLANLADATAQEVFDQVATHLLIQNEKAINREGRCRYRFGKQKLKCAAGCLISDDEYKESFECHSWQRLIFINNITDRHAHLIGKLQNIHDSYVPDDWRGELILLAKFHHFMLPPIFSSKI